MKSALPACFHSCFHCIPVQHSPHQQLMHNVYDTQESQSKVNEILSAVSFHGNELSYGERIAEISSVSSERLIERIHLLDHL